MGFFDSKSQTTTLEPMLEKEQMDAMKAMAGFMKTGQLGAYTAGQDYNGSLGSYGVTPTAQQGINSVNNRMSQPGVNQTFNAGTGELQKILQTDNYDPNNPQGVYKGFKTNVLRELGDSQDALNRNLSVTGNLYSTENGKQSGLLQERAQGQLTSKLAELYDQFANRKFQAAGQAVNAGATEASIDSNLASQALQMGEYERQLQDQQAKDKYSDFMRKNKELSAIMDTSANLFNRNIPYGQKSMTTTRPSVFMSMLGEMNPLVGSYNQHQYGYDVNQTGIGQTIQDVLKVFTKTQGVGAGA